MIRKVTLVALLLVTFAGSACSESDEREGEWAPTTPEELDVALRAGARKLLDTPGFEATTVWFGEAGGPVRSAWLDYQPNGDYLVLLFAPDIQSVPPGEAVTAFARVDGETFTAEVNPAGGSPWSALKDTTDIAAIPLHVDLEQMAEAGVVNDYPPEIVDTQKQAWPGGGTAWMRLDIIGKDSHLREWRMDADGVLVDYSSNPVGESPAYGIGFKPIGERKQIQRPQPGAPLNLDTVELPDDVRRFEP